jgi:hypothetical protein
MVLKIKSKENWELPEVAWKIRLAALPGFEPGSDG